MTDFSTSQHTSDVELWEDVVKRLTELEKQVSAQNPLGPPTSVAINRYTFSWNTRTNTGRMDLHYFDTNGSHTISVPLQTIGELHAYSESLRNRSILFNFISGEVMIS
jgi:hypothetical protein